MTNGFKVERVQRRAARWVKQNYSPYDSVSKMVDSLGWRTLEQRRADTRLVLFYKIVHSLVAIPLPDYFEQPLRLTRNMHPLSYRQVHTRSNYYQFSFFPMTIVIWNRLPADVVMLPDLDAFKREVCKINHPMPY